MQFKFIGEGRSVRYSHEFDNEGYQIHLQKILPRLSRPMSDFFENIQLHDESLGAVVAHPNKSIELFFSRGDRIRLEKSNVLESSFLPVRKNLYAIGEEEIVGASWMVDELLCNSDDTFRWNVLTELGYISFRFQDLQHSIEEIHPTGATHELHFKFYKNMSINDINSEKFFKKESEYSKYLSALSGLTSDIYNTLCRKRFSFIPVQQIIEYGNRTLGIQFYNHQKLSFRNVASLTVSVDPVMDLYNRYGLRVWYFDDAPLWLYHEVHVEDKQYCLIIQIGDVQVSFAFADVILSW